METSDNIQRPVTRTPANSVTKMLAVTVVTSAIVAGSFCSSIMADEQMPVCPIMTDNQAVSDHYVDHNGLRYYFCCDQCVADFQSDPSRFTALKSVSGFPIPGDSQTDRDLHAQTVEAGISARLKAWTAKKVDQYCLDYALVQWHLVAVIVLMMTPFLFTWFEQKRDQSSKVATDPDSTTTPQQQVPFLTRCYSSQNLSRIAWTAVIILACDTTYLASLASERHRTLNRALVAPGEDETTIHDADLLETVNEVHFNTFAKYGFPPRPRSCNPDNGLSRTYYRGNDERHVQMFNGGQYRTVTFHVQLESEDGSPFDYGDSTSGQQPFLKVVFERAPFTSNGYFTSEYMQRMYLTMKADRFLGRFEPVKDRIQWTETVPGKIWEARYQIPSGDRFPDSWKQSSSVTDGTRHRGVLYLCEDRFEDDHVAAGRYHFAVEYDIRTKDNVILPESNIIMGSTHESRNSGRYNISDREWFGTTPIPEKPE